MGKETKIGLSVIGVLMIIFSCVLYYRLSTGDEPLAEATDGPANEKAAAEPAATKLAVNSKLIPGSADTPLSPKERNWAQAHSDAADDDSRRPHARHLVAASNDSAGAGYEQASDPIERAEPARGNDPFAARGARVKVEPETATELESAADEATDEADAAAVSIASSADEELQPLPARVTVASEDSSRDQLAAQVAEEGDPTPTRVQNPRAAAITAAERRGSSNQPTPADGTAAQMRVSQASDQQPDQARQPFRSRTTQPTAAAEDRYGQARQVDAADSEDLPRRTAGDFAAPLSAT